MGFFQTETGKAKPGGGDPGSGGQERLCPSRCVSLTRIRRAGTTFVRPYGEQMAAA